MKLHGFSAKVVYAILILFFLVNSVFASQHKIVNVGFLESKSNLSADIVLTKVPLNLNPISSTIIIQWTPDVTGTLKYSPIPSGAVPENYLYEITDPESSSEGEISFQGSTMTAGVWYAIIVSGENNSQEFVVIIEADTTPQVKAPRTSAGEEGITTNSPAFSWNPVQGVPFYHLILSDQEFIIEKNEAGALETQGANVIWQAITSETSVPYGLTDPSGFYSTIMPPPLVSNVRYNWVILNNYGNNPAFTSTVTGGVVGFSVNVPPPFNPPVNLHPVAGSFINTLEITFAWSNIADASMYRLYLSRLEDISGSTALVPVWEGISTEPIFDLPGGMILQNGYYTWKVLAQDNSGGGAMGDSTGFNFSMESSLIGFLTYDVSGERLPRANLSIAMLDGDRTVFPLTTDESGTLERTLPVSEYIVTATKAGYDDTTSVFSVTKTEQKKFIYIYLRPSLAKAIGTTIDQNADPLGFVDVTAALVDSNYTRTFISDQNGWFTLSLSPGTWTITTTKTGYQSSETRNISVDYGISLDLNTDGPFVLTKRPFKLSGSVLTPGSEPIWNAEVISENEGQTERTFTNSSGLYALSLSSGVWKVSVYKDGYTGSPGENIEIFDSDINRDFELTPRANILMGRVKSGGQPIDNSSLTATPGSGVPLRALTNEIGEYRISLPKGDYKMTVAKEGYATSSERIFLLNQGETFMGVDFELQPLEVYIEGVTYSNSETPLGDVTIKTIDASTISDQYGHFRLGLAPGTHTIRAEKTGYITPEALTVTLNPGQTLSNLKFKLLPNASVLQGNVSFQGLPVTEAVIKARLGETAVSETSTDSDGNYTLNVAPGDYELTCSKQKYLAMPDTILVTAGAGQSIIELNYEMILNAGSISGTVSSGTGNIRSAKVYAIPLDVSGESGSTQTGVNGKYLLSVSPNIPYKIEVQKKNYYTVQKETNQIAPGEIAVIDFTLTFEQSAFSGAVLDEQGIPVENATVLASKDTLLFQTSTDHKGQFFLGVNAGSYLLEAQKVGYSVTAMSAEVALGDTLSELSLTATPILGSIDGAVLDQPSGEGIPGAYIRVKEEETQSGATGYTDSTGRYEFSELIPGVYTIMFEHQEYIDKTKTAKILTSNGLLHVDFNVSPTTGQINGECQLQSTPVEGVTIIASDSLGGTYTGLSNERGIFAIENLPPRSYTVQASFIGYRSDSIKKASITGSDTVSVSFEFSPNAGKITGVVRDVANEIPLSNVQILAIGENGNAGQDTTGVDGRYELTSLAPDTYLIKTILTGYLKQESIIEIEPETSETLDMLLEKKNIQVDGFVLDQTGNTLADIQVRAVIGDQIFQTNSLQDGSFALIDLPPEKVVRLSTIIVSQGYDNADTTITIGLDDISNLNMTVTVHRVSISGTTGEPTVKIIAQHQTRKTIEQTYSDAQGNYTLEKLYPGTYEISAEKEGFISPDIQTVEISNPYDAIIGINFSMETGSIAISGRIISRSTGLGIENAPVSIWSQTQSTKTKADAEGNFNADNLPPNKDYIIGTALDSRDFENADTTVAVSTIDFNIGELLIRVHNGIIKGSISDDQGNLLGDAYMTVIEQDTTLVTGAQGNFRLPYLFSGNYTLNAAAVGYNDTTLTVSVSEFDSTVVNISLFPKVSSLYGTVKYQNLELKNVIVTLSTANDLNVVGVDTTNSKGYYSFDNLGVGIEYQIAFTKTGFHDNTFQRNTLDKLDISMLPLANTISGNVVLEDGKTPVKNVEIFARTQLGDEFSAFSDGFGDFAILALPPGTYTLVAPYSDSLASPAQIVELEKDASIRKVLILKKTAILSGIVLADGKSISGALVTASNSLTGTISSDVTDDSGFYKLSGLIPGNYVVTCEASGYNPDPSYKTVSIESGASKELNLTMIGESNSISGRVVNQNFASLADVEILAVGTQGTFTAITDRSGQFIIENVPLGVYVLNASLRGYREATADTVEVTVDQPAISTFILTEIVNRISGIISDSLSGEPLAGVIVMLVNGESLSDTTGSDGAFLFEVQPGIYEITISSEGYITVGPVSVELLENNPLEFSSTLERDFSLTTINGFVKRRNTGLPNVNVTLLPQASMFEEKITTTNVEGSYLFKDVNAPSFYKIKAVHPDYGELVSDVIEIPRDGYNYDFIYHGSRIVFHFTEDGTSAFTDSVEVAITGLHLEEHYVTDSDGNISTADNLPGGEYEISIAAPDTVIGPESFIIELAEDALHFEELLFACSIFAPDSINAADSMKIMYLSKSENVSLPVYIFYKPLNSLAYVTEEMVESDQVPQGYKKAFEVIIEPQKKAGTFTYYVKNTIGGRIYSNRLKPKSINISGEGVLNIVEVVASVSNVTVGVPILLEAKAYDQMNNAVVIDSVSWSIGEGTGTFQPVENSSSKILFSADNETSALIRAKVYSNIYTGFGETRITTVNQQLDSFEITTDLTEISNREQILFSYVATDQYGKHMTITPMWTFNPSSSGSLHVSLDYQTALFIPDSTFVGQVFIQAVDMNTQQSVGFNEDQSIHLSGRGLSVYHNAQFSSLQMDITDGENFRFTLPSNPVLEGTSLKIKLEKIVPAPVKRLTADFELAGTSYNIVLMGSSLAPGKTVRITFDVEDLLTIQNLKIGRWNSKNLQWDELETIQDSSTLYTVVEHFSEFGLLKQSDPLSIKQVDLRPNPFSPHDPYGLQIGFEISSNDMRKPYVTVSIYNMAGDLVRTAADRKPMEKGIYQPGDPQCLMWDGQTDNGDVARNGRYIVKIEVEDSKGVKEIIRTAVLIK